METLSGAIVSLVPTTAKGTDRINKIYDSSKRG